MRTFDCPSAERLPEYLEHCGWPCSPANRRPAALNGTPSRAVVGSISAHVRESQDEERDASNSTGDQGDGLRWNGSTASSWLCQQEVLRQRNAIECCGRYQCGRYQCGR